LQRLLNIGGCLIKCFLHVLSAARPLGLLNLVEVLLNILVQILSLKSLDETAINLAPAAFISCIIAVPTPDAAAWTSTVSEALTFEIKCRIMIIINLCRGDG
jgi:hypothetical protein